MKNNFYIDRQFGIAIWIDVRAGIVRGIHNEHPLYCQVMEKQYKGKSISFLAEDFKSKMQPIYHQVHSTEITDQKQVVEGIKTRMNQASIQTTRYDISDEERAEFKKTIEALQKKLWKAEVKLEKVKVKIAKQHNFN